LVACVLTLPVLPVVCSYGDSLAAVDLLKRSFQETYTATLPVQKEVLAEMESEQEAILTKLQEAKDALAAVEDSAAEYTRQLDLAVERFEKFPTIDRVEGWLEAHAAVFARGDYGEASLAAVNVHIANFEESFTLHLANKKAVGVCVAVTVALAVAAYDVIRCSRFLIAVTGVPVCGE